MSLKYILLVLFFLLLPNIAATLYIKPFTMNIILIAAIGALIQIKCKKRLLAAFILFFAVLFLFRLSLHILPGSIQSIIIWMLPALIAFSIPNVCDFEKNKKYFHLLFLCLGSFFALTVLFAIVEFLGSFHILNYQNTTYGSAYVVSEKNRAVALAGSSLTNALIMSEILIFVLNSYLKEKYKYILWFLGFVSLLCFQGRLAIIVSALYFMYYLFTHLKNDGKKNLMTIVVFSGIVICSLILLYLGFGSRLYDRALVDQASAGVRMKMLRYLQQTSIYDYIWGMSMDMLQQIMVDMKVLVIECFAVIHVILFGVVFTAIGYILYAKLLLDFFKDYALRIKLEIIILYVTLAAISNSFASSYIPLTMFLLCARLFNPSIFVQVVPQKYLKK